MVGGAARGTVVEGSSKGNPIESQVWPARAVSRASLHEWPPGVIDRALQVDVWPDRIELEVSLGLSDATVQMVLKERLPDGEEIASTPEARTQQLQPLVLDELCQVLELTVDGQSVAWQPIRSELSSKHHVLFFCYLEAPLQIGEQPVEIEVRDRSFPKLENQLRLALRPRRTQRLRANVAPLVIRADRIMLSEIAKEDADAARRMRAIVAARDYDPATSIVEQRQADTQDETSASESSNQATTLDRAKSTPRTPTPDEPGQTAKENGSKGSKPFQPTPVPQDDREEPESRLADESEAEPASLEMVRDSASSTFVRGQLAVIGLALLFVAAGSWLWLRQGKRTR